MDDDLLAAIGWCLLELDEDPSRLEMLASPDDAPLVTEFSRMLIFLLQRNYAGTPREQLETLRSGRLETLSKLPEGKTDD
ncbi:hypothetical protein [Nesterenkonia sp. CF4.4]|uniref:hypothetical protein n=1 Tax=Nesterenkonia sp. CF4.4 TaxID=3373079 RepID=UPI003EE64D56